MPEGDTVYRAALALDRALSGQVLTSSDFRVPAHALADLSGWRVLQTVSRGKHLLTRFTGPGADAADEPLTLHTHLMMEGAWRTYPLDQRWQRPSHQARVVLRTRETVAVGFSLGIVELLPTAAEDSVVGHLGPDLLGPDWDADEALRRLLSDPRRALRDALLDQRNLAGIGNMYAAELCFLHGIDPQTPVGAVPRLPRLLARAQQLLEVNKQRAIPCTTGDLRPGRRMWVYGRDRGRCLRCASPISVTMSGEAGRERASYWCPVCQERPDRPGSGQAAADATTS